MHALRKCWVYTTGKKKNTPKQVEICSMCLLLKAQEMNAYMHACLKFQVCKNMLKPRANFTKMSCNAGVGSYHTFVQCSSDSSKYCNCWNIHI